MSEHNFNINLLSLPKGGFTDSVHLDGSFFAGFEKNDVRDADVEVSLQVVPKGERFIMTVKATGSMSVPCDRCLDLVEVPVSVEDTQLVELGSADTEEDIVVVPEKSGILESDAIIYDILITNLPLTVRHRQGECNPEMERLLQAHLAKTEKEEPEE